MAGTFCSGGRSCSGGRTSFFSKRLTNACKTVATGCGRTCLQLELAKTTSGDTHVSKGSSHINTKIRFAVGDNP